MNSKNTYLSYLGDRIRFYREKKGYSQLDLALEAKMSKNYLGELELGKRNPSILTLKKLADALEIDISYLLPF